MKLGATFKMEIDDKGKGRGELGMPAQLGGPATIPMLASLTLVDQETLTVTLDQEFPPLLRSWTGPFTLEKDTATMTNPGMMFDFGKGPVAAGGKMTMVRK